MVALFSLLGIAHALQANERELGGLSEEFTENSKQIVERLDHLEEELEGTRKSVAEASMLAIRSVEKMLWDLRATKETLSTRVATLESRVAAQELDAKRAAAEVGACPVMHMPPVKATLQAASDLT